ncbi:zinc transporter ZntB [Palleronia sp. KMU-117]|uniref:zinc transporter ZntB n=1 Tax=Palleronia sp. KMU-117 TaxID=3434108 RepID=UPI003D747783
MTQIEDIIAYRFDGKGKAVRIDPDDAGGLHPATGTEFLWVHIRRDSDEGTAFLGNLGLDNFIFDALTAQETRPRCTVHGDGVLVNLRGVNLQPGAEPEDMVSVRFWIEGHRIVGAGRRTLHAVEDLIDAMGRGQSPSSPGDFIARLALRLSDRAEPAVADLNEELDTLEEAALEGDYSAESRRYLPRIRQKAIALRRFMVPQRDALTTMEIEDLDWLSERDRSRLREAAERVTRLGEELDAIRDRAQVVHDQIMDERAEAMNRNMLLLSVVTAIFLPLGLVTGLLGINVGGIPGAQNSQAFFVVCGLLAVLAALQVYLVRRFGLMG